MSENTANLYQAPDAELTKVSGKKPILAYDRFSAWGVFFLSIITLGIYPLYWLVNRTATANALAKNQINMLFPIGYIVIAIVGGIYSSVEPESPINIAFSIATLVFWLVSLYSLRTSITEIINEGSSEPVKLGPILTFFFSIIYLQYKINEAIDNQK